MKDFANRFVAYYRVSTEKQDLDIQRYILRQYLQEGWICEEFAEIESGKHMSTNKELYEAIDYCKENNKILAVSMLDRIGRDAEHALKIHRELDGWIYACNVPNELGGKMDRMLLTFYMAFAERERELISIRTKAAFKKKREAGYVRKPHKPLSPYRQKEANAKMRKTRYMNLYGDPQYAKVSDFIVKRINEYKEATGKRVYKSSYRKYSKIHQDIADELNALKVEMPQYYKTRHDKFTKEFVSKVYDNETKYVVIRNLVEGADNSRPSKDSGNDTALPDDKQKIAS